MKLVELLLIIAKGFRKLARRITQRKRQEERDELENAPGEFMSQHFGGLQHKPTDADKADAKRNPEK